MEGASIPHHLLRKLAVCQCIWEDQLCERITQYTGMTKTVTGLYLVLSERTCACHDAPSRGVCL